jgi:DNA (cytosine-5)-methyltransferase 1
VGADAGAPVDPAVVRSGTLAWQPVGVVTRPRLLDLFCGAGGAGMGYHRAGFDVTGVDINPQPNYPFEFHQADAIEVLEDMAAMTDDRRFHAIHTSPPCQAYSVTASLHDVDYPELITPVRALLAEIGLPSVIENVQGAPLVNAIRLCGSSFGLGVRRHRLFEITPMLAGVPPCSHHTQPEPVDVTGTGGPRRNTTRAPGGGNSRKPENLEHARAVMGIDWMTRPELSESIPPAYTEWIGRQLVEYLELAAYLAASS